MPNSILKENYVFDDSKWVVSLLNTGAKLGGHTLILVEGTISGNKFIGQYDIKATLNPEEKESSIPFFAKNAKGFIHLVEVHEGDSYVRKYQQNSKIIAVDMSKRFEISSSRSWYVLPAKVQEMIDSIKEDMRYVASITEQIENLKDAFFSLDDDKKKNDILLEMQGHYPRYQVAGIDRFFGEIDNNGGHNCATWCIEKLSLCGVVINTQLLGWIKTPPQKLVGPGSDLYDNTIEGLEGVKNNCIIL